MHKLTSTIKELYGVTEQDAVNNIAINHVVANIDDSVRDQVRILQLAGNANLTVILELINSCSESFPLRAPQAEASAIGTEAARDTGARLEESSLSNY